MVVRILIQNGLFTVSGQGPRCLKRLPSFHDFRSSLSQTRAKHAFPHRATTAIMKSINNYTRTRFMRHIKRELRTTLRQLDAVKDQRFAIVILATPTFAHWLEDDSFIIDILKHTSRAKQTSSIDIDVVCACVDGLAPSIEYLQSVDVSQASSEGISLIYGLSADLVPGLWDEDPPLAEQSDLASTLTFSGQDGFNTKITVPLANTLFTTGTRSTLLASAWESRLSDDGNKGVRLFTKRKTSRKPNQLINVFDNMDTKYPMTLVPATPLTPVRKITSGLGNIVRQLEFGPSDIGPASRELEASVNNRVKSLNEDSNTNNLGVWALIVPEEAERIAKPNENYSMLSPSETARTGKIYGYPNVAILDYIGYWMRRGAVFCKVLSGGGGWGAKQGLLSLDPQLTYSEDNHIPLEMSGTSLEEQQTSALGNIAKPGSFIRFFARTSWKPWVGVDSEAPKIFKSFDPATRTVVIGTSQSTIDMVPEELPQKGDETFIRFQSGAFRCSSQSGVFITKEPTTDGTTHKTKLDMPGAFLFTGMKSAYRHEILSKSSWLEGSHIESGDQESAKLASIFLELQPSEVSIALKQKMKESQHQRRR